MSERIYIPLEAFQKTFGRGEDISLITVAPKNGVDGFELEKQVLELLRERHRIAPDDERAILANNLAREAQMMSALFTAIGAFVWFVGIGTLMAGIIGISNIMIITVKERTREIGLRKALGATPWSIVSLILMESIMVTSVAGYCGLVLGVGLLEGANYLLETLNIELAVFERPEVNFDIAVTALVLLVVSGSLAGLVPALKAARVTPVEAMRNE
jgi:putative ABC transport system permease protein